MLSINPGNPKRWTRMTKGFSRLRTARESVYIETVWFSGSRYFRAVVFGRRSRRVTSFFMARREAESMLVDHMRDIAQDLGLVLVSETLPGDARI